MLRLSERGEALAMCVLGGTYFGYNTGIISGLEESMVTCHFFPEEGSARQSLLKGMLTASVLLGGLLGVLVGVPIADRLGRRPAYITGGVFGLATALLGIVNNFWGVLALRTIAGLPVGLFAGIIPLYVTEVCPARVRGSTGTVFQVFICFSILLAQVTNLVMSPDYDPDDPAHRCVDPWRWKAQLSAGVVPAVLVLVHAMIGLPESREWLRRESLLDNSDISSVIDSVLGEGDQRLTDPLGGSAPRQTDPDDSEYSWGDLLCTSAGRRWAAIGAGLACTTQLTGINAIIFYGPEILKDAGLQNILVLTVALVGTWNFLSVFVAVALVDKLGRRPLILSAVVGMTLSSFLLFVAYAWLADGSAKSAIAVLGLMGFIFFFEIGPGALFFLMASELFPLHVRSKGLVFANLTSWLFNIAVTFGFPVLDDSIGPAHTFLLLAAIGMLCAVFCFTALPETKDL